MIVTEHLQEHEMEAFRAGRTGRAGGLSAAAIIRCAEHLETCSACAERLERVADGELAPSANGLLLSPEIWFTGRHLDYEELRAYLERQVRRDQARLIKSHLDLCPGCSKDLADLEAFRRALESELRMPAFNVKRYLSFFNPLGSPGPAYLLGALTVLVLLSLFAMFISRRSDGTGTILNGPILALPGQPNVEGKDEMAARAELLNDHGKQLVISYLGDQVIVSNLAPELQADAARMILKIGRGQGIGESLGDWPKDASPEMKQNRIREARDRYSLHFELGIYYLKAGLLDQAENEFQQLLSRNRGSKLIESICRGIGAENAKHAK